MNTSNMRIINTGNKYQVFDSSMRTFDALPAQAYSVCFNQMTGWYLTKYSEELSVSEKIYGVHLDKVKKVLSAFHAFQRNLGVILSGDKGIGKSLFSKLLSQRAMEEGYPLIIVNAYIPGIADFIDSIDQECVILFDEFDKTFYGTGDKDPQAEMLTLFDGISQGKKMFVVTCNSLNRLNDYLVNRPGRFHYHFRFSYPSDTEITEYMQDKLEEKYWNEIPKVVSFSKKVSLNYDCLRAVAFELSCGLSFEEAIKDLNIINTQAEYYSLSLYFKDGTKLVTRSDIAIDIFDSEKVEAYMYDSKGRNYLDIEFDPSENFYDVERHGMVIKADDIDLNWIHDDEDIENWNEEKRERNADFLVLKNKKVDYLLLRRRLSKDIHYAV